MKIEFTKPRPGRSQENKSFDGLTIDLNKEVILKSIPSIDIKISKIEVLKIEDNSNDKTVIAYLKTPNRKVVLWEGKEYDNIGQWTDTDVENRLKEIFK